MSTDPDAVEVALEVLARLSANRVGNGRLRDAIALVRSELLDILEDA